MYLCTKNKKSEFQDILILLHIWGVWCHKFSAEGKQVCIDIQMYDLMHAIDALWLADCMNGLFDTLLVTEQYNKLAMMYEGSRNIRVSKRRKISGILFLVEKCPNSVLLPLI